MQEATRPAMVSTMMAQPLSLNHLLERAGQLFPTSEIVRNSRSEEHTV